jgi:hypothetical protein
LVVRVQHMNKHIGCGLALRFGNSNDLCEGTRFEFSNTLPHARGQAATSLNESLAPGSLYDTGADSGKSTRADRAARGGGFCQCDKASGRPAPHVPLTKPRSWTFVAAYVCGTFLPITLFSGTTPWQRAGGAAAAPMPLRIAS